MKSIKENLNNESVLEQGNAVHEVAKYLFGSHINIEFSENLNEMIKESKAIVLIVAQRISTIRDADIAEVSSEYIKMQILQQASSTLLATANQTPSIALQLI